MKEALRVFGELERQMMRLGNWVIALVCGSMGVFTLWFCSLNFSLIPYAVGFFGIAFLLEATNWYFFAPQRPAKRR